MKVGQNLSLQGSFVLRMTTTSHLKGKMNMLMMCECIKFSHGVSSVELRLHQLVNSLAAGQPGIAFDLLYPSSLFTLAVENLLPLASLFPFRADYCSLFIYFASNILRRAVDGTIAIYPHANPLPNNLSRRSKIARKSVEARPFSSSIEKPPSESNLSLKRNLSEYDPHTVSVPDSPTGTRGSPRSSCSNTRKRTLSDSDAILDRSPNQGNLRLTSHDQASQARIREPVSDSDKFPPINRLTVFQDKVFYAWPARHTSYYSRSISK